MANTASMHALFLRCLTGVTAALLLLSACPALAQDEAAHQQFLFAYKLIQRGDDELAAEAFDEYLGNFPDAPKRGDALYFRALLHRRAGELEAAANRLETVPEPQLLPDHAVDLLRGQVNLDLDRHEAAVEALERIDTEELDSATTATVRHLLGLAYRGTGNTEAAVRSLQRAAEADARVRGEALIELGRLHENQGRLDQALEALEAAFSVAETAAEAARLAGDFTYEAERYGQAADYYRRVIGDHQSSDAFGPALLGLLWSHYSAGEHERVVSSWDRLGQAGPEQTRGEARYLVGSALQDLERHEEALSHLQPASENLSGQQRARALRKLARSHLALEQYDQARAAASRLGQDFDGTEHVAEARLLLARIAAREERYREAVNQLTPLIEGGRETPGHARAVRRRARLYAEAGETEAAAADYERYLAVAEADSPRLRRAMLRLIQLYQEQQSYEAAADLADRLLAKEELAPEVEQEGLYRQALARIRLGNLEQALASLARLAERHPLSPYAGEAAYYRGLALMSLDRSEDAVEHLRKAADRDDLAQSQRIEALRLLAVHHREAGETAPAAENLTRLEKLAGRDELKSDELLWLGRHRVEREEPERGLGCLAPLVRDERAVERSQQAEAAFFAGLAHRQLGKAENAIARFEQVVALGAGFDLRARLELARTLADQGERDRALSQLNGLIDAGQTRIAAQALLESARLHREQAQHHDRRSNPDRAQEARDEARKLLTRLLLLYDFEKLEPLPQRARLELMALAEAQEDREARQEQLEHLSQRDGPYGDYARALLTLNEDGPTAAAKRLRELAEQDLPEGLADRVRERIDALER